ncbi:MAG: hypothetical protein U0W40_03785 [Acidimicrobiia bacterium]
MPRPAAASMPPVGNPASNECVDAGDAGSTSGSWPSSTISSSDVRVARIVS